MEETVEKFGARVVMDEDGSIKNRRIEGLALLMADGLTQQQAWTLTDGENSESGSRKYRNRITAHPVFKLRLENLMSERDKLYDDPLFGESLWMANQMYRHAVAIADMSMLERAVKIRFEVSKAMAANRPSLPGTPPTRGAGAPVAENTQTRQSANALRDSLMAKGIKVDQSAEEDEEV